MNSGYTRNYIVLGFQGHRLWLDWTAGCSVRSSAVRPACCCTTSTWVARPCSSLSSHVWLTTLAQFPQRISFKLCLMTHKCLHGVAPTYLSQCCLPVAAVTGRSRLRSADDRMLYVPRTQTVTLGPRAFSSVRLFQLIWRFEMSVYYYVCVAEWSLSSRGPGFDSRGRLARLGLSSSRGRQSE